MYVCHNVNKSDTLLAECLVAPLSFLARLKAKTETSASSWTFGGEKGGEEGVCEIVPKHFSNQSYASANNQ